MLHAEPSFGTHGANSLNQTSNNFDQRVRNGPSRSQILQNSNQVRLPPVKAAQTH